MLLDSLRTLVERLIELSPRLNRPLSSVLPQWQSKLEIFIEAINGKKPKSDCDEWVAGVKVLAADVEEILNEIAGTQTFEEPSKNCIPFSTSKKGKPVLTVNGDLKTKIDRASGQLETLNARRTESGLLVGDDYLYAGAIEIGNLDDYIESSE